MNEILSFGLLVLAFLFPAAGRGVAPAYYFFIKDRPWQISADLSLEPLSGQ